MAYRYEWTFDVSRIGSLSIEVAGLSGTSAALTASVAAGLLSHGEVSSVLPGATTLASALQAALRGLSTGAPGATAFSVSYAASAGYTIGLAGDAHTLSFPGSAGTRMRQALGFAATQGSATAHASDVRPYYLILPAIDGRSRDSDEYEPPDLSDEGVGDSGSDYLVSVFSAETHRDWTQPAESETAPASAFSAGTFVHERLATTAVPWTYQQAWRHARAGNHAFAVLDDGTGFDTVHRFRAAGARFRPERFSAEDFGLWSLTFRTRQVGRL